MHDVGSSFSVYTRHLSKPTVRCDIGPSRCLPDGANDRAQCIHTVYGPGVMDLREIQLRIGDMHLREFADNIVSTVASSVPLVHTFDCSSGTLIPLNEAHLI